MVLENQPTISSPPVVQCVASADTRLNRTMAKRITKAQREQAKADEFRRIASSLLNLRHNDWNDWEYEWLHDEVRRRPLYIYTEREHEILDKLSVLSKSFTEFGGYTITELIAIAYPFRFDLDEDDQEFLEKLYGWRAMREWHRPG